MKVNTPITFDTLRTAALSTRQLQHSPIPPKNRKTTSNARSQVLQLGALTGHLCGSILTHAPLDHHNSGFWSGGESSSSSNGKEEVASSMGLLLLALFMTAKACSLDLKVCILKKIELNGRKYPVELCKGKSGKYTAYSHKTGITKDNQSTLGQPQSYPEKNQSEDNDATAASLQTIEEVTDLIRKFATDRKWSKYHTPRNIVLALLGEVGELAELFQWRGDNDENAIEDDDGAEKKVEVEDQPPSPTSSSCSSSSDDDDGFSGWSEEEIDKVGQELADVSIYLLRLADVCNINVGEAAMMCASGKVSSSS